MLRFIYDRRKKSSNCSKGVVELEIVFMRKQKRISTGVSVFPHQWSDEWHVIKHPDAVMLNMRLESIKKPVLDYISTLMIKEEPFTFEGLNLALNNNKHNGSFIQFVENRISERKDIQEITRRSHSSLISSLKDFKKIVLFSDLTLSRIKDYDAWLHGRGYTQSTVAKYHKFLKCYINEAIDQGLVEKNPYIGFKVDKGKAKERKYLTEDELIRLMAYNPEDKSVDRAKDMFIFQCFTGLAYVDLVRFDFTKVEKRENGYFLLGQRSKTGESFYIRMLSPAIAVLQKYNYKLPVISNQKYNTALKALGMVINRSLTSHMGRHTAATMFLNNGMPIEIVSKILGHSNTKQTMEYAKIVNKTIDKAFELMDMRIDGKITSFSKS